MNILVTGHRGFIGNHLYRRLAVDHNVRGFEWGETLKLDNLDWVLHLGAISSTVETNVELVFTQNYDFSCDLLDQCIDRGINFQFASSASVYGLGNEFKETSPADPKTPYAWSKYLFERYVYKKLQTPLSIVVQGFRYFNVYSSYGEDHKGNQASPYFKFKQQAQITGAIKLFENSERYLRDFVTVEQVCDYHKQFLTVDQSGVFNIGTGKTKSFLDVAKEVVEQFPAKIEYIPMPDQLRSSYQYYTCADMTKTNSALNTKNVA